MVSNELELDVNLNLGLEITKEQFLEWVKRHAVSHVANVAKKAGVVEEVLVETPQVGAEMKKAYKIAHAKL